VRSTKKKNARGMVRFGKTSRWVETCQSAGFSNGAMFYQLPFTSLPHGE
jgi:hypothetical protein